MSVYAFSEPREGEGGSAADRHLRVWLAASARAYDATTRELFVRAHPALFGRAAELALRGYDRWRWRRRLHDTPATFARYITPRHERWLAAQGDNKATAPCLIGDGGAVPCWALSGCASSGAQDALTQAA